MHYLSKKDKSSINGQGEKEVKFIVIVIHHSECVGSHCQNSDLSIIVVLLYNRRNNIFRHFSIFVKLFLDILIVRRDYLLLIVVWVNPECIFWTFCATTKCMQQIQLVVSQTRAIQGNDTIKDSFTHVQPDSPLPCQRNNDEESSDTFFRGVCMSKVFCDICYGVQ